MRAALDQCAARHQHDAAAQLLDRRALLLVGAMTSSMVTSALGSSWSVPAPQAMSAPGMSCRIEAAPDQLQRCRPIQPHAALRGIHRLGDAEPERPEVAAEGDGALPVDRGVEPRIGVREWIGDDMRGRIGDAVERRLRAGKLRGGRVA